MSKVDKLLQNIFEYRNLLSFPNKNHPQVLEEWKIFAIDKNSSRHWVTGPATRIQDGTTKDETKFFDAIMDAGAAAEINGVKFSYHKYIKDFQMERFNERLLFRIFLLKRQK